MQENRKLNKLPDALLSVVLLLGAVCMLGGCGQVHTDAREAVSSMISRSGTAQEVSSAMRQFVIGPDEKAIYLASAADVIVYEAETVSGNDAGGPTAEAGEVFVLVNQARKEIGLAELIWSDELAAAADVRAEEIQKAFSHTRPDGSDWWTVDSEIIYGENLAKGYQSADSVMTAWMESSEHKDNILYSAFQTIGIAVYEQDGKWYWVQEFGY